MKINQSVASGLGLALIVAGCLLIGGCAPATNQYEPPPPPDVTTAKPVQQKLTLFIEENGQTEPVQQAEVRTRVKGFVQKILFDPGQEVKEGQELYAIEPDTYEATKQAAVAAVEAAKAAVLVAEATLANANAAAEKAKSDFDREKRLLESNAGSQSAYDAAQAARDSAAAQIEAAKANIESAKAGQLQAESDLAQADLDLNYTTVRALIDGRISKTDVKLGNLVEPGDTLANVVDQGKIFANFSISDRKLLEMMKALPEGEKEPSTPEEWSKFAVYLQRDSEETDWFSGRLEYVDQEGIDEDTGTFGFRAEFDNTDRRLLPGMFVIIRMPVREIEDAILIPERAVTRSQAGTFVLVVGSDNTVERRIVTLGQTLDGWVYVKDGLAAEESFVLDGLQRARPGSKVTPLEKEISTADSPILQASQQFTPK